MQQEKILLIDFHEAGGIGRTLLEILKGSLELNVELRYDAISILEMETCQQQLLSAKAAFDPALLMISLPGSLMAQDDALFKCLSLQPFKAPIVAVVETDETDHLLALLNQGVVDFIIPPVQAPEIRTRIWRILEQVRRKREITTTLIEKIGLQQLVGSSPDFLEGINKTILLAGCNAGVLILGETGTGKELFARSIHYLSARAKQSFIPVNCGAIPAELIENELFGHERGAFTGAVEARPGLIQEANGGTIFLDEIDTLPLQSQVKFLRFLQTKEYRPLGATRELKADVRVIAASNANIEEAVAAGRLRRDLYYRLNVVPLKLSPLRDRAGDIPQLARHFLAKYAVEFNKTAMRFSPQAIQSLELYSWPGNVRELEHVVERAVVLCEGNAIESRHIVLPNMEKDHATQSFQQMKARFVSQFEKTYIEGLLLAYNGNISRAALAARKNRRAFWQLVRKHKIDAQKYRQIAS